MLVVSLQTKVCPCVCSTNSCCRAGRVLYTEVALFLRWECSWEQHLSFHSAEQADLCAQSRWEGDGDWWGTECVLSTAT